ncbi:unnamed protein product [Penicillium pancosmium]
MKYFAAILSIASLALATTETAPGSIVKQQGVGNITISPVEALRILKDSSQFCSAAATLPAPRPVTPDGNCCTNGNYCNDGIFSMPLAKKCVICEFLC